MRPELCAVLCLQSSLTHLSDGLYNSAMAELQCLCYATHCAEQVKLVLMRSNPADVFSQERVMAEEQGVNLALLAPRFGTGVNVFVVLMGFVANFGHDPAGALTSPLTLCAPSPPWSEKEASLAISAISKARWRWIFAFQTNASLLNSRVHPASCSSEPSPSVPPTLTRSLCGK